MKRNGKRGSALVLVLVSSIILAILAGALFVLFKSNIGSHTWNQERIQARCTAEAGANLAIHMIMEGADVPQGMIPVQILPEFGSWELLSDEMGYVQVWVDPNDDNPIVSSANAYEIRALSKVISATQANHYGMASMVSPRNFAVYATFLNQGGTGYYGDGYRFDGPFHSNTAVRLSSATPGRDADPYFYSFSVASDYYFYRDPSSGVLYQAYEPQYGLLWVEPYERMILGDPHFVLGAESIPFGSSEVTWQGAYNAALAGGLVLDLPHGDSFRFERGHMAGRLQRCTGRWSGSRPSRRNPDDNQAGYPHGQGSGRRSDRYPRPRRSDEQSGMDRQPGRRDSLSENLPSRSGHDGSVHTAHHGCKWNAGGLRQLHLQES